MTRLHKEEFVPFAPEGRGQVRINHSAPSCSGESKSMVVRRLEDGSIAAKCHRCGAWGREGGGPMHYGHPLRDETQEVSYIHRDGISVPEDTTSDFPDEVAAWIQKSIPLHVAEQRGLVWSPAKQQLYIPVVQETSAFGPKAAGAVLRRFEPKRYLTLTQDPKTFWGLLRGPQGYSGAGGTLLIVEDMLSAIKGAMVTDTLALLGTSLKPQALAFAAREGYNEAVVWLDADNTQVRMAARTIARQLPIPTRMVETGDDPKNHNVYNIRQLVNPKETGRG